MLPELDAARVALLAARAVERERARKERWCGRLDTLLHLHVTCERLEGVWAEVAEPDVALTHPLTPYRTHGVKSKV